MGMPSRPLTSYRNSTERSCVHTREFNNPVASHLARWLDMNFTMDIAISECRRREAIFRNNGIGSLVSTPCAINASDRCKYEDTCQRVPGDLEEL
jgi:hypothetical protein